MFDLNAIVSAALNAAVQQAIAPLNERIAKLELCNAERHQRLLVLEGALTDRVVALEGDVSHKVQVQQANITAALAERIAALENNPAQGVDTSVVAGNYTPISNEQIKAALQEWATKDSLLEHLDNQEWFWEKLQNRIDAATESAMDLHCETYDHDSYDEMASKVDDLPDLDDYVTRDEVRSEIEDVLNNATLSLSI